MQNKQTQYKGRSPLNKRNAFNQLLSQVPHYQVTFPKIKKYTQSTYMSTRTDPNHEIYEQLVKSALLKPVELRTRLSKEIGTLFQKKIQQTFGKLQSEAISEKSDSSDEVVQDSQEIKIKEFPTTQKPSQLVIPKINQQKVEKYFDWENVEKIKQKSLQSSSRRLSQSFINGKSSFIRTQLKTLIEAGRRVQEKIIIQQRQNHQKKLDNSLLQERYLTYSYHSLHRKNIESLLKLKDLSYEPVITQSPVKQPNRTKGPRLSLFKFFDQK